MAAPANDNIAGAQLLLPGTTQVTGTNLEATRQTDEAGGGTRTVWFRWVAPSSASATITSQGTAYDTIMNVFTPGYGLADPVSAPPDFDFVTANDDEPGGATWSSVTFTPDPGRTYYIQLSGYYADDARNGPYTLNYPSPGALPWLNKTSGIAARNGTNSHTIPFGFTSTSGNELVVIVYGGVTHTASGWTERLSPVSSGELSVFTKTSAGDSSITVVHNGSNYPVGWVAYELPAGSTWTGGTGVNANSFFPSFPDLTGLPGTTQLVIAARGRVAGSTAATSASTVWNNPLFEDADLFAAHDGSNDGAYLTVGHTTTTDTSISPAAVSTYDGTWTVDDRQQVVFAITLGTGGSGPATHNAGAALAITAGFSIGAAAARQSGAALAATATIATTASRATSGAAALAVTATVAAGAARTAVPGASLAATATVTAAAVRARPAGAALAVTAGISTAAAAARSSTASLAATATITAAAIIGGAGSSAALAATATVLAGAGLDKPAGTVLAATASLVAGAVVTDLATSALAVTATLTAGAGTSSAPSAAVAITAAVATAASRTATPAAALAVTATLTADAVVGAAPVTTAAALAVVATVTAGGARVAAATAALSVTATLNVSSGRAAPSAAALAVTVTVAAGGRLPALAGAALAVTAVLVAAASALSSTASSPAPPIRTASRPRVLRTVTRLRS